MITNKINSIELSKRELEKLANELADNIGSFHEEIIYNSEQPNPTITTHFLVYKNHNLKTNNMNANKNRFGQHVEMLNQCRTEHVQLTNSCQTANSQGKVKDKAKYDSAILAFQVMNNMKFETAPRKTQDWTVYLCSVCGKYHFGSTKYLTSDDIIIPDTYFKKLKENKHIRI